MTVPSADIERTSFPILLAVELLEPDKSDIDRVVKAVLFELLCKAVSGALALVGAHYLSDDEVGYFHTVLSLLCRNDHKEKNVIVLHI